VRGCVVGSAAAGHLSTVSGSLSVRPGVRRTVASSEAARSEMKGRTEGQSVSAGAQIANVGRERIRGSEFCVGDSAPPHTSLSLSLGWLRYSHCRRRNRPFLRLDLSAPQTVRPFVCTGRAAETGKSTQSVAGMGGYSADSVPPAPCRIESAPAGPDWLRRWALGPAAL
jgi:hypothetical protein